MEEVNANLLPIDVFKQLFTRKDRDSVCALKRHANAVCRNFISEDYIRSAMNRFDRGYTYKTQDGQIVGFTIWKELSDARKGADTVCKRYLYLLLICADQNEYKLGSRFLYDIETYASTIGATYIELQPLNDRLRAYYEAHGYLSHPPQSNMTKDVVPYIVARPQPNIHTTNVVQNQGTGGPTNRRRTLKKRYAVQSTVLPEPTRTP